MAKTPVIKVDALLNLALDEKVLKGKVKAALGTSVREAAKSANIGDGLVSPAALQQLRKNLQTTFQAAGKDLNAALDLLNSKTLKSALAQTRTSGTRQFGRDWEDLLSGKGRAATRNLPALPAYGKEILDELHAATRVFGREALRTGGHLKSTDAVLAAQRNVGEINKVLKELAGIPAVAAKDLQKIQSLVNSKDLSRYQKMQGREREDLSRAGQALQLQTKNLDRLATSLSRMGFGETAAEIRAANQARKALANEFVRMTSPPAIEARARKEAEAQARADRQLEATRRQALAREIKARERAAVAEGVRRTVVGPRDSGYIRPGILAAMDAETRARMGLPSRAESRARSQETLKRLTPEERRLEDWLRRAASPRAAERISPLDQVQQNIARASAARQARAAQEQEAALTRYNEQIRLQGDRQLQMMEAFRQQQERVQGAAARRSAGYQDAQRIIAGVGGIRGLTNPLDFSIVRNGLSTAYRQAQAEVARAAAQSGRDSQQHERALADLSRIRAQRDQLADRLREVRAGGADRGGGGRGAPPGPRGGAGGGAGGDSRNLLATFGRYALGYGGLYQLLDLVIKLKNEIIELDRALYSIKAITQATDLEMKGISRSIKDVALNTNFSTAEIAKAAEILGQAGVTPADMGKTLEATAKFASATSSSLQVAADLMTTVKTVYKTLDEGVIADQLTRAINLSKLTAEDLQQILSLTAQTAVSYNVNLQQLLAGVTTLRNAGVKAQTVATGMRQAMLEIFNPTPKAIRTFAARYRDMGGEDAKLTQEQIRQRFFGFSNAKNPLVAALTELRRMGFTDEGQRVLQRSVNVRAFNAVQGLINNFGGLADEDRITFGQAAIEGADTQLKSLAATLENLSSSVTVLAEQLSRGLVRQLAAGGKEATNLIERLTELDVELQARGEGGINQMLGGAAAGAITGFSAGTGFKGKAIGAVAGALGGGFLTGGYKLDESGEISTLDVVGIAAAVGTLALFIKKIAPLLLGLSKVAAAVGTIRGPSLSMLGLGGASIGSKIIPVIGWILTAVSVVELLSYALGDETEAEKLRARAEAAATKAAKSRKALEENVTLVESYDPGAKNPRAGTAAESFAKYREQVENFGLDLSQTLGEVAEDRIKALETALRDYIKQPFSQRDNGPARKAIEAALGRPLDDKIDDHILFSLGVQREAIDATVKAFVDNTRMEITAVTERIIAAREAAQPISAKDQAMSDAFSENAEELQKIIDQTSDLSPEETQQALVNYYKRFVELVDKRPKAEMQAKADQLEALTAQLAASLASADNSDQISQLVSQISNGLEYIGLATQAKLESILGGLDLAIAKVDSDIEGLQAKKIQGSASLGLGGLVTSQAVTAVSEESDRQIEKLKELRALLEKEKSRQVEGAAARAEKLAKDNQATAESAGKQATALVSGFEDPAMAKALNDPKMLRDIQLSAKQIKYLQENKAAILSKDPVYLAKLTSTTADKEGRLQMGDEYQTLDAVYEAMSANLEKQTKAQERAERDQKNLVTADEIKRRITSETETKIAEANKNFGLLASDSANNPIVKGFEAQREILKKELAQAQAKVEDARDDGSKSAVDRQQTVFEIQAKLDTLDLEKKQELEKYAARARDKGVSDEKKAQREAQKQAAIKVAQTGIEQRKIKQDFDEAIRVGDTEKFLSLSKAYEEVQQKLIQQLSEELTARGYTTDQIMAEIELRQDLNKPLAQQVENIRKLADQQAQQRELDFRDIGSGPALGSKYNTAYLGVDGFTTEEQMAAATRDIFRTLERRNQVTSSLNNPIFADDAETLAELNEELERLDYNLGETQANLDRMANGAADNIYAAFSPRNLILELERSAYTFDTVGDNLRSSLGSAIDDIGHGLAEALNTGQKLSEVLKSIVHQAATRALGDMFTTNLNEGLKGLVNGATGKDGGKGGLSGVLGSLWGGVSQLFGFGGDKQGPAQAAKGGEESKSFLSTVTEFFGLGKSGGAASPAATPAATDSMFIQAGSVTVSGPVDSSGAGAGGAGGKPGGKPGSMAGAFGGAMMGVGIGAALGGAVGGKKGSKIGAIAGALLGAYMGYSGFGLQGGGTITPSGRVVGSGRKGVDSVPVAIPATGQFGLLAPGEGVLNARAMDALGAGWLHSANSGRLFKMAMGGVVGQVSANTTRIGRALYSGSSESSSSTSTSGGNSSSFKIVNVMSQQEVRAAFQTREGEDLIVNALHRRGALSPN